MRIIKNLPLEALKAAHLIIQVANGCEIDDLQRATGGGYCGGCETCVRLESSGMRALDRVQKQLEHEIEKLEKP